MPLSRDIRINLLLSCLGVLLLVGTIGAIILIQRAQFQTRLTASEAGLENKNSASFPRTVESALTRRRAAEIIQSALAGRQIVVQLVLGDVVTADAAGRDRSQAYIRLAKTDVVDLKFCRFPGDAQGPRQVCIAQLSRAAQQYVSKSSATNTPIMTIAPEGDEPPAPNRQSVDLVIARAILKEISTMIASSSSAQDVHYTAVYAMTPIATAMQVKIEDLPRLPTVARLRKTANGWQVDEEAQW
jgi:translation initiation factor IF-1